MYTVVCGINTRVLPALHGKDVPDAVREATMKTSAPLPSKVLLLKSPVTSAARKTTSRLIVVPLGNPRYKSLLRQV